MSEYTEQIEALRVSMKKEQLERKAQIELLRAEMKSDCRDLGKAVEQVSAAVRQLDVAVEDFSLGIDARLEGLTAVFQNQIESMDDSLSIVSGVTLSQADKQAQMLEEYRAKFDAMEHWFQQVSDHEKRLTRIEEGHNPAA